MKKSFYLAPSCEQYRLEPAQLLCLSFTGGNEDLSESDMEKVIIDETLDW